MPAQSKIDQVKDVTDKLTAAKSAALIQYQGLTALDISDLRDKVRASGGRIEVIKNRLITLALKNLNIELPETLTGPTAIAFSNDDEISPLKEIDKVNNSKEVTSFKFGIFDQKLLSVDQLKTILSLPSKSTLIARFVGGLANPLQRLLFTFKYNQTQLVLTLKALADKQAN